MPLVLLNLVYQIKVYKREWHDRKVTNYSQPYSKTLISHEIHVLLTSEMCKSNNTCYFLWLEAVSELETYNELDVTRQTVTKSKDVQPKPVNKVRPWQLALQDLRLGIVQVWIQTL